MARPDIKQSVLLYPPFKGLDEYAYRNNFPANEFHNINNYIADERQMLCARPGTHYIATSKKLLHWEKIYIQGKGDCIIIEVEGADTQYYNRSIYWTQDLSDATWLTSSHLICELVYNVYPCQFLGFQGKLWITDGAGTIKIWDGESCKNLIPSDTERKDWEKFFMRGQCMTTFAHRIWFANTPECSYAILYSNFTDEDDREVSPSDEGAWSALKLSPLYDTVAILGIRPLSETILGIYSRGGIFGLRFPGNYPSELFKISDISCLEGHYFKSPFGFDTDKKAYLFTGTKVKEIKRIQDTVKNDTLNPLPLSSEIFVNLKNEWDRGNYTGWPTIGDDPFGDSSLTDLDDTRADWEKNILTPDYAIDNITMTNNLLKGPAGDPPHREKYDHIADIDVKHDAFQNTGQSFTVSGWFFDDDSLTNLYGKPNLPHLSVGFSLYCEWYGGTAYFDLLEYDSEPLKLGEGDFKVLASAKLDTPAGTNWKDFWWKKPKEYFSATLTPIKLKVGKKYYLCSVGPYKIGWQIDDSSPTYYDGEFWLEGLKGGTSGGNWDCMFRIYYAPASTEKDCIYYSPVFHAPDLVKGQILSLVWESPPTKVSAITDIGVYFRSRSTSFDWDAADSTVAWIKCGITNKQDLQYRFGMEDTYIIDLSTQYGAEDERWPPANKYFQYGIRLRTNEKDEKKLIPKVYAVKITYKTQDGQIKTFQDGDNHWLMLKTDTLILTPAGWYKIRETSDAPGGSGYYERGSMVKWKDYLWMIANDTDPGSNYYLKLDDNSLVDFDGEAFEKDITLDFESGAIDCGFPENRKIFRQLLILEEINYEEAVPFELSYRTEEVSKTYVPHTYSGTAVSNPELHLWIYDFPPSVAGKFIIFEKLEVLAKNVRKIKSVELRVEVLGETEWKLKSL